MEQLKVLIVEDKKIDAALLIRELKQSPHEVKSFVPENKEQFKKHLTDDAIDIIISDYSLPRFSALEALEVLKSTGLDIPLIIISGVVGEDRAIEAMQRGARDFIIKDKLFRLLPAISREINEAAARKEQIQTEELLNSANVQKTLLEEFVSGISHDLRTPITSAKISAQMIGRAPGDEGANLKRAHKIIDSLNRLDQMIENLLDANRIKAGEKFPAHLRPCNIGNIVNSVTEEMAVAYGNRFLVESSENIESFCDESAIRRALENLIGNAVKYGSENTPILVKLLNHNNFTELLVHNEGNPISKEDQDSLFTNFRRTKAANGGTQRGWGIGLTLVRGIVESHKGTVKVESSPAFGTTFTISLPKLNDVQGKF